MTDKPKVHVKFFAVFREYVGLKEEWREIEPGITVEELWQQYVARAKNPRVGNIRAAYAVNQRLAKPDTVLHGGEEVGFLPPVSGGADARRPNPSPRGRPVKRFWVTDGPLSVTRVIRKVEHPSAGGIAVFVGVVRDHSRGQTVKFLEYEAYPELAEKMLAQIGAEVQERWSDVRLAIAHRTGRIAIGGASVIIAASAPHRAEAFAACRYAIERLKVILPVWKKEFTSDQEYWVEGPPPGEISPEEAMAAVQKQEEAYSTAGKAE